MADEQKITQADLDKAVKDAVAAAKEELSTEHAEAIQGLKDKNTELLGKLRKASGVSPEDLAAVEQELTQVKADLAEATKQVKTLTTERDKAVERADGAEKASMELARENAIGGPISKAGLHPDLVDAFTALVEKKTIMENKEGKWAASTEGKETGQWIEEYLASEAGKHLKLAVQNGGGGAPGGKGGGSEKTMTRAEYNEKIVSDPKGTNAFLKEGGRIVDQAA